MGPERGFEVQQERRAQASIVPRSYVADKVDLAGVGIRIYSPPDINAELYTNAAALESSEAGRSLIPERLAAG